MTRALGSALVVAGALLLHLNRDDPDESRLLAVALVAIGAAAFYASPFTQRLAEMSAVALVFLLGGEWMVRRENDKAQRAFAESLMHMVSDPELRYEMKPHTRGTNSLGMLDGEHQLEKAPGTLRVACVGDSVGGDFELRNDNVCAVLGRAPGVEALNFSVPGYNTMQEARAFERKALPFHPDALVVLFVLNDPYPELAISHQLPGHLKFAHLLVRGVRSLLGRWVEIDPFDGTLPSLYSDDRRWNKVVVAGFNKIAAAAHNIKVVVAVFPLFVPDSGRRYGRYYRQVVDEAKRHGFVGIDLWSSAFEGHPLKDLLKPSRDAIHPNAAAHRLAAQAILKSLLP
jgi:hypothetical protein